MKKRNTLERFITAISALLVAAVLGVLLYQLIFKPPTEPQLIVTIGPAVPSIESFAYSIKVKNLGTTSVKNVKVEVHTEEQENPKELSFDFIAGESSVQGWVNYESKPDSNKMKAQVTSYVEP